MTRLDVKYILDAYGGKNFQCIDAGNNSKICYIFFSSNGLYYPDEERVFQEKIIKKDRYEWKWVVQNSKIPVIAGRVIYVRDLFKDWYSKGINKEINTLDKTLDLLKTLTEGYQVVTVGSSAGGYMAVLSAIVLNAAWCINFSGQYIVKTDVEERYRNLTELMKEYKGTIFYYVPAYSEQDILQYNNVKGIECVKEILFKGHKHAETMFSGNMSYIIDRDKQSLDALYEKYRNRSVGKIGFLLYTVPFMAMFKIVKKEVIGFLKRKIGKHDNGI